MISKLKNILGEYRKWWLLYRRTTPFVIFFAPRSGSTFVVSKLNSHPHVVCQNEVFHTVRVSEQDTIDPGIQLVSLGKRTYYRRMSRRRVKTNSPSEKQTVRRMKQLFARKTGACGFKFSYPNQIECFPEIVAELQKLDPDLRVIVLRRRNVLKMAVSQQNLERIRSRAGSLRISNIHDDKYLGQFHLDVDRAMREARVVADEQKILEPLLQPFEHVLRIDYEDMIKNVDCSMRQMLRHIGVSEKPELSSKYQKATPDDLREAIENYEELESKVKGTELEAFLSDD